MGQVTSILVPLTWRIWLGTRIFPYLGTRVYRVSWHRVVKGPCYPPEIEAMEYIASHTTIPIPKVYRVHRLNGMIFLEMEYLRGTTLESVWNGLSREEKDALVVNIKKHMTALRDLQPPRQDLVSSAFQNRAYDCRIGFQFFGPMDHTEFVSLTRGHLREQDVARHLGPNVAQTHSRAKAKAYRTHFTHGDFAQRNILVQNGRLVAIIDWECAGWFSEYWELTRAFYCTVPDDWRAYMHGIFPGYETELAGEEVLWRMLPEPGAQYSSLRDGVSTDHEGSAPSAAWLEARKGRHLTDLWALALSWKYPEHEKWE